LNFMKRCRTAAVGPLRSIQEGCVYRALRGGLCGGGVVCGVGDFVVLGGLYSGKKVATSNRRPK